MEKPTCTCRAMLPGRGRTICKASLAKDPAGCHQGCQGSCHPWAGETEAASPCHCPSRHHPDAAPPGDKAVAGAMVGDQWLVARAELCSELAAVRHCQAACPHGRRLEALHRGRLPTRRCLWRQSPSTRRPRLGPAPHILMSFSPRSEALSS